LHVIAAPPFLGPARLPLACSPRSRSVKDWRITDRWAPATRDRAICRQNDADATGSRGVGCRERCLRGSNASSPSRGAHTRPRTRLKEGPVDQQHESQSSSAKIATSAVQVLHEYTGRGPTKAKTTIDESVVTILLADTLTTGERTLVDHGHADRVLQVRHDYQTTMRDELVGIVERELHREVIAFMSQNHIDPDLAVEV